MSTARYHRDQAKLCLDMASQMSDRNASDMIRAAAVRHFAQATELEKIDLARKQPANDFPPGSSTTRDSA
jgi:hypothetical protein